MHKKVVIYCRGGIGDFYPFLASYPQFLNYYNIKDADVDFFLDSAYVQLTTYPVQRGFLEKLFYYSGINNFHVVPFGCSSYGDLYGTPQRKQEFLQEGQDLQEFMEFRSDQTKQFFQQLMPNYEFFIDIPHTNRMFIWGQNKYIGKWDAFKPTPVPIPSIQNIFADVVLNVRRHYHFGSSDEFYRITEDLCERGIQHILLGAEEGNICTGETTIDLRNQKVSFEEAMTMFLNTRVFIGSSSFPSMHRLYGVWVDKTKYTFCVYPKTLGEYSVIFKSELYKNSNTMFANSEEEGQIDSEYSKFRRNL